MNRIRMFQEVLDDMEGLFKAKDSAYGGSYKKNFNRFGLTYPLTRICEKVDRLETLKDGSVKDNGESIEDNLLDIANIAVLALIELRTQAIKHDIEEAEKNAKGLKIKKLKKKSKTMDEMKKIKESGKHPHEYIDARVLEMIEEEMPTEKIVQYINYEIENRKQLGDSDFLIRELEYTRDVVSGKINPLEALFKMLDGTLTDIAGGK